MNELIECRTQEELEKCCKEGNIAIVRQGVFTAYDSSQVRAYDSSQVRAYGSSQVRAYDSSQVRAYDSSQVRAYDSSQVRAYDSSQVRACDSSQVRAYGSSQVRAYGSSQVRACDSSQVRAYGSSQVRAYDSSQVTAYGSSQVTAYGSSQVTAYGSSQVTAYGSSQVRACDSSQVRAYGYVAITNQSQNTKIKHTNTCSLINVPPLVGLEDYLVRFSVVSSKNSVILYKAVQKDLQSFYSSKVQYPENGIVKLEGDIDPSDKGSCAHGLHFAHYDWAIRFGEGYGEFVILRAEIKKKDIVVSPDCDGQVRCSKAKILEVIRDWQHYQPEMPGIA